MTGGVYEMFVPTPTGERHWEKAGETANSYTLMICFSGLLRNDTVDALRRWMSAR